MRPCPFCNSGDVTLCYHEHWAQTSWDIDSEGDRKPSSDYWYVACDKCNIRGPRSDQRGDDHSEKRAEWLKSKAIARWNGDPR